ncbi:MAG: 30S ribosomal protein S8, partial [Myxococcaceae bacterium]|nr:30S ribosomal protein S8 [Myxococcaceae bacterium]
MFTDPIGDMLTRIRNGAHARHARVRCPSSQLKLGIARVLAQEGFLSEVRVETDAGRPTLVIELRYDAAGAPMIDGIRRVSRPGRRVYVGVREIPKVRNGLGVAVLSTPKGVLADRAAR